MGVFSIRTCVVCRKRENPNSLLRVLCVDGNLIPDPGKKLQGRGASIHRECILTGIERKVFRHAFKRSENPSADQLKKYLEG